MFFNTSEVLIKWSSWTGRNHHTSWNDHFNAKMPTAATLGQFNCRTHSFFESSAAIKIFRLWCHNQTPKSSTFIFDLKFIQIFLFIHQFLTHLLLKSWNNHLITKNTNTLKFSTICSDSHFHAAHLINASLVQSWCTNTNRT